MMTTTLLAMCADTGMLIGALFFVLVVGAVCLTSFVFAAVAFSRWVERRRKRGEAGDPAGAGA